MGESKVKIVEMEKKKRNENYSKITIGFHEFRGIVEDNRVHSRISFRKLG